MNSVSYFEIQVDEPEKTISFYSEIFGWKFEKDETIPVDYWRIQGAGPFGGLLKRIAPVPQQPAGTNAYVCSMQVENFDASAKKILKRGGKVALEKFAVAGKCWQGYFIDTQGNTFGIFEVDEKAV
jgi:predicted enzyme related to lactoylglutathione lyase